MLPNEKNNDQELEQFLKDFEENAQLLKDDALITEADLDAVDDLAEIKALLAEPEGDVGDTPAREPRAPKKSWRKTALITVSCIMAALVLTVGGLALYINHLFGLFSREPSLESHPSGGSSLTLPPEETVGPDYTGPTMHPSDVTMPTDPAEVIVSEDIINIMLIGEDAKAGYYRGRTDTMILCTINTKNHTITLTSFMRDLYVTIPGMGNNRLNAAYVFGGFDLFKETMLWNFGVEIEDIVKVELECFDKVVDILGGVSIELTEAEAKHLNMRHGWSLSAGSQLLDGEQALAYSRIRYIDSDFYRTKRQQKVLESIFQAYKSKSLTELLNVTEKLLPNLTVTMSREDLWSYLTTMVPMLPGLSFHTQQIPAKGTYEPATIDKMAVLVPDLEANREIIKDILQP